MQSYVIVVWVHSILKRGDDPYKYKKKTMSNIKILSLTALKT